LDCNPGFLTEVISQLKQQAVADPTKADVCLMFDAMSIKKETVYDTKSGTYAGFVNFGTLQMEHSEAIASNCLVVMAVGLKKFFKMPVGYFLFDGIKADLQAQMVKDAICLLTEAGLNVHAVICDGAYTNQATATSLGCKLSPFDVMDPTFPHPCVDNKSIYFIFDACHLIKGVRNALADMGVLIHQGQKIEWRYIAHLHEVQMKDNLHLANKLKGRHLDFLRNKMNVKLAVQALSSSVAKAIDCLRDDLHCEQFIGSQATTHFISTMDKAFDLCNSSNFAAKGFKSPINSSNLDMKAKAMDEIISYIMDLRDHRGELLVCGKRKTSFIGFITTLTSLRRLSTQLIQQENFRFVLTYRFSQDHLETFFSRIRRRFGWNNNPNALQFKWALRSLLQKNGVTPSARANCQPQPVDNQLILDPENAAQSPMSIVALAVNSKNVKL